MSNINLKSVLVLIVFALVIVVPESSTAFFWDSDDFLVEVNGEKLTADDFDHWWQEWKDPQTPVPETPDEYIEWLLLAQEAESMQLYDDASFRRKMSVFMKVRSLMMIRQEEVSNRIVSPTDADLKKIYQGSFSPYLNLRMMALQNEEEIAKVQTLVTNGTLLKDVAEQTGYNDSARFIEESGEMRPRKLPEPLREVALTLKPGQVSGPVLWQDSSYFVELLSEREGTDADFESVREHLLNKYNKNEDQRLTNLLIENLRKKYRVEIDQDYLSGLGFEEIPEADKSRTVIDIGETKITAEQVQQMVMKQLKVKWGDKSQLERLPAARNAVAQGIVTQTLLGMESLDRHYEKQPPLKYTFEFYRRNTLIKHLEQEVIRPMVKVEQSDIQEEYDSHPERYVKQENQVELIMVDTKSEKLATVLSDQLKSGEDFRTVMQVLSPNGIKTEKKSLDGLSTEIREVVSSLAPGQSAGPIQSDGKLHFVKVIGFTDRALYALGEVESKIRKNLSEDKYSISRNNYLHRLKQNSTIKTSKGEWKKLRKQLLEKTNDQN